jgi:two-component system LytT family response regulator
MRVLIVDDERPARAKLRRLLGGEPDVDIVGEAATGAAAVEAIAAARPDVVFLDVQMPVMDGFGVIEAVGLERMPFVVFATAHDAHAVRAFEVRALDYLLKPFAPDRFRTVLARVRHALAGDGDVVPRERLGQAAADAAGRARLSRLLVRDGARALLLAVGRIDLFEADGNRVRLHADGRTFAVRTPLADLAARLDPAEFLQISRSAVVRLDAVREMQPWFHGDYRIVMRDGRELMWSRRFRARTGHVFDAGGVPAAAAARR